jgi:chaperone LolA
MLTKNSLSLGLALLLASMGVCQAGEATDRLNRFFANVQSMQAHFVQSVASQPALASQQISNKLERSEGLLRILRPGRFRWDYQKPYEQEIVADGKRLWVFDIEMDQVIVKPLDLVLGNTPAILLSGNASLTDRFIIDELPDVKEEGLSWLSLKPKEAEASYEKVWLGFNAKTLVAMDLVDGFGQKTQLRFTELQLNPRIDPKVFDFTPPPGVDVIGDATAD